MQKKIFFFQKKNIMRFFSQNRLWNFRIWPSLTGPLSYEMKIYFDSNLFFSLNEKNRGHLLLYLDEKIYFSLFCFVFGLPKTEKRRASTSGADSRHAELIVFFSTKKCPKKVKKRENRLPYIPQYKDFPALEPKCQKNAIFVPPRKIKKKSMKFCCNFFNKIRRKKKIFFFWIVYT